MHGLFFSPCKIGNRHEHTLWMRDKIAQSQQNVFTSNTWCPSQGASMSTGLIPSFHTLPVELLHRILDHLDTQSILLSFRTVCQRFRSIVDRYHRYELDCSSLSKIDFHIICRVLHPENFLSIHLSDDQKTPGQIELFLGLFGLDQFVRLRSLTLIQIANADLITILKQIPKLSLHSLTIKSRGFPTFSNIILPLLSLVLARSNLRQFEFSMWCFEIYQIDWPNQCLIKKLKIDNRISLDQFCTILRHCINLKQFIMKDILWDETNKTFSIGYFRQLTSLILEDNRMDIFKLEQLLSLTPSLIYLKIIGMAYLVDNYRWEKFIRTKLVWLNKFEFFFISWENVNYNFSDVDSLIAPFRTTFWLENKRWLVTCDYVKHPAELVLYSIPICKSDYQYHHASNKISCSTSNKIDIEQVDSVCELRLNLTKVMTGVNERKDELPNHWVFRHVTELTLDVDGDWPWGSHQFISKLIDLSQLVHLSLYFNFDHDFLSNITTHVITLLDRASHVRSLELRNNGSVEYRTQIENICRMIPKHIQHLKMTVEHTDDMKIILDRLEHLSSVVFRFEFYRSIHQNKLVEWLKSINRNATYCKDDWSVRVWLNKKTTRQT